MWHWKDWWKGNVASTGCDRITINFVSVTVLVLYIWHGGSAIFKGFMTLSLKSSVLSLVVKFIQYRQSHAMQVKQKFNIAETRKYIGSLFQAHNKGQI